MNNRNKTDLLKELHIRLDALSNFEKHHFKIAESMLETEISRFKNELASNKSILEITDTTPSLKNLNIKISTLCEKFDTWFDSTILLNQIEERIAKAEQLKDEYPALRSKIQDQIAELNRNLEIAQDLLAVEPNKTSVAHLIPAYKAFDEWASQITSNDKSLTNEELNWVRHQLVMQVNQLKKQNNLQVVVDDHGNTSVKKANGDTTHQPAAKEIEKILQFLKKIEPENTSQLQNQFESKSPMNQEKSFSSLWSEISQNFDASHIDSQPISRNMLMDDLELLKHSLSTEADVVDSQTIDILDEITTQISDKSIPNQMVNFSEPKSHKQSPRDNTEDWYSKLGFEELKNELLERVANDHAQHARHNSSYLSYLTLEKPFTNLAVKGLINLMEELPEDIDSHKIENQLRSSLRAWDSWHALSVNSSGENISTDRNKNSLISESESKEIIEKLTAERQRILNEYKLTFDKLGTHNNQFVRIIIPREDNNSADHRAMEIAISQVMNISDLIESLKVKNENEQSISLNELKQNLENLKRDMPIISENKSLFRKNNNPSPLEEAIQILAEIEKPILEKARAQHLAAEENNRKQTERLASEEKKRAQLGKEAAKQSTIKEKKSNPEKRKTAPNYSTMSRNELASLLVKRFNESKNIFTNKNPAKAKILEGLITFIYKPEMIALDKVDSQLRSMLKAWDAVEKESQKITVQKSSTSTKHSEPIPDPIKIKVINLLNQERRELMARYQLAEESIGTDYILIRSNEPSKKSDRDVETVINRIMEIDEVTHKLEQKGEITQREFLHMLSQLKRKMRSTGIGLTSSTSAKAIQQIINQVNKSLQDVRIVNVYEYPDETAPHHHTPLNNVDDPTPTHTKAAPTQDKSSSSTQKSMEVVEQKGDDYSNKDARELIELLKQRAPNNSPTNHSLESGVLEVITHDSTIDIEAAMTEEEPLKLLGRDPQQDMIELKILENQLRSSLKALDLKEQYQNQMSALTKKQGETAINQNTVDNIIGKLNKEKARIIEKHHLMYITIRGDSSVIEDENAIDALVRKDYYKDEKNPDKNKAAETVISRVMEIDNFIAGLKENKSISIESVRRGLNELKRRMRSTGFTIATGEDVIQDIIDKDLKIPKQKVEGVSRPLQGRFNAVEVKKAPVEAKETKEEIASNDLKFEIANLLIEERDALLKKHPPTEQKPKSDVLEFTSDAKVSDEAIQALKHANAINKMYMKLGRSEIKTANEIKFELEILKKSLPEKINKPKSSAFLSLSKFSSKPKDPPIDRALKLLEEKHKAPAKGKSLRGK